MSQLIPKGCECPAILAGMAAKRWMFAGGLIHQVTFMFLLLVGLLVYEEDSLTVYAQGPDAGKLYLDRKESEVKEIAGNATVNNKNCGSLDGCSDECSRVTCYPVSGGRESLQCTSVDNNEFYTYCPSGACRDKMMVDYNRSYVTCSLPAPASTNLQTEVARDICFQRILESTFKTVSVQSEYSLVYFGSTSGAFRAFPGREQNGTQCSSFDARKRPWYLNGISVSKDVKILVDVANSMGRKVTVEYKRPPQTTYLDVTKNITQGLLQTFSPQDYVEVFSFDNSTATSLGAAVQINSIYDYKTGLPELAALVTGVNELAASPDLVGLSDLNTAILKAVSSFNPTKSLKVVIVLSNGLFVPLNRTTFPSLDLQKKQAKLMVYKLPTNDDSGDPFLLKTPSLQENLCSVKGSFESLDAPATANPLYSMRSYFTYLARIQLAAVHNKSTWSNPYASVSQDRDVITPTYPAFGSDGLLIGVAGIDVVIENIDEPLRTWVYDDIKKRQRGTLIEAPANISMTCNYQNKPSANSVCPDSIPPDSSAICPRTDTSSSLADRTCCGTCGSGNVPKKSGLKPWNIALISVAPVALVAIAVAGICYWKKHQTPVLDPGNLNWTGPP